LTDDRTARTLVPTQQQLTMPKQPDNNKNFFREALLAVKDGKEYQYVNQSINRSFIHCKQK